MAHSWQADSSLSLAKHLFSGDRQHENLVFSPLSMHVALAMTAGGSNAPTRRQILSFLNSDDSLETLFPQIVNGSRTEEPIWLSVANGLWVDRALKLKPAFLDIIYNAYGAFFKKADFRNKATEVREEVNAWAERETNGLIKEMVPPGTVFPTTKFVLACAVYFKGIWVEKFDAHWTHDGRFYLLNGSSVRAPFMTTYSAKRYVQAFDGFQVLKMPYRQGEDKATSFSMYVYLPDAMDGLPALVERVCSQPGFINSHIPSVKVVSVDGLRIPKFKIKFSFEASDLVKKLGVVLPFRDGSLSEMVDCCDGVYVEKVYQGSLIIVNEDGTEAAAACAMCGGGCGPNKREFMADHPFLFVIREDESGVVLFMGQLLNPLAAS